MRVALSPSRSSGCILAGCRQARGRATTGDVRRDRPDATTGVRSGSEQTRPSSWCSSRPGRVRVLKGGVLQSTDFVDLRSAIASGGERGSARAGLRARLRDERPLLRLLHRSQRPYRRGAPEALSAPIRSAPIRNSRFDLVWPDGRRFVQHPFSNHNGGNLAFGPDGFLYVGMGDGGSGNDPQNHAQSPQSLLGKMLAARRVGARRRFQGLQRCHPPIRTTVARTCSVGDLVLRLAQPWRWSFDNPARGGTGAILIADVGQNRWEEINYEPAGAGGRNYGWRIREGAHNNVTTSPAHSRSPCANRCGSTRTPTDEA